MCLKPACPGGQAAGGEPGPGLQPPPRPRLPARCTHLPSAGSSGSGTQGPSPSPPSRGCTGASAAQGEALGRGGGSEQQGHRHPPSRPARGPQPRDPLGYPGRGRLPLRNCWVWGSRSQRPGVLGELSSQPSVAWKVFFSTWRGQRRLQRPGQAPARPLRPPSRPVPRARKQQN